MQETPSNSMERARKIMRISLHTFLQHYQYFTSLPTFLSLPFSISLLLSQTLLPHSFPLLPSISGRLGAVFRAAGFPNSGHIFALMSLKLSQTISTFILTLPFSISFLLLSKALIFHFYRNTLEPRVSMIAYKSHTRPENPSFLSLYQPILTTYLCNSFLIVAVNATCFSLFFLTFTISQDVNLNSTNWVIFLTIISIIFYSIVLGNTLVICNISLMCCAFETHNNKTLGFMAILRTCLKIKGKTTTALSLALPINLGMAAIEALFHYRIVDSHNTKVWLASLEGVFISYIYSILLVLEVIMSCVFYQYCIYHKFRHDHDDDINLNLNVEELEIYHDKYVKMDYLGNREC